MYLSKKAESLRASASDWPHSMGVVTFKTRKASTGSSKHLFISGKWSLELRTIEPECGIKAVLAVAG